MWLDYPVRYKLKMVRLRRIPRPLALEVQCSRFLDMQNAVALQSSTLVWNCIASTSALDQPAQTDTTLPQCGRLTRRLANSTPLRNPPSPAAAEPRG
jgi:hypothetical protein